MDSDSSRPQDIIITDDNPDGALKIRSVTVYENRLPDVYVPIVSRIVLASVVGSAIIAGSITGLVIYLRMLGEKKGSEKENDQKAIDN